MPCSVGLKSEWKRNVIMVSPEVKLKLKTSQEFMTSDYIRQTGQLIHVGILKIMSYL